MPLSESTHPRTSLAHARASVAGALLGLAVLTPRVHCGRHDRRHREPGVPDGTALGYRLDRCDDHDAIFSVLLRDLGYKPHVTVLSVPVTFASMKNKDIDVFLGNWMPSQEGIADLMSRTVPWKSSARI